LALFDHAKQLATLVEALGVGGMSAAATPTQARK
jgi:hypothetical protein